MDDRLRTIAAELRQLTSVQAADWLMETYPVDTAGYGEAITLIPHRSWKRPDQLRLARHYLQKLPFATARPYEAFASFMAFDLFIGVIREQLPKRKDDFDLLMYHLSPVLTKFAKTDADRELMRAFVSDAQLSS